MNQGTSICDNDMTHIEAMMQGYIRIQVIPMKLLI